ncbi:MAG: hypothetical protein GY880_07800 [Planctomycetaceae bacterium]|jgi:Fe-S cluster assembly iron-binding protein IscA|nr:hypothetical protein [Planctomycetaceae bacterium]
MKVSDTVESRVADMLGEFGGFLLIFLDKEKDTYTLNFVPVSDVPDEPFFPLSRHVLLDADSAAFLEGASLEWSDHKEAFYLTLPDGAVNLEAAASFTFH